MELIFWFSIFMIFYAYFGYAMVLMAIDTFRRLLGRRRSAQNSDYQSRSSEAESQRKVSFIITAYNEEARIGEKIENTLEQSYPADKLEIIVASDCSNDKTDNIVGGYAGQGVKLVRAPEHKGKENAQMYAVHVATGEILVFSDVATILEPNAIRQIVSNFTDASIGCVSSEDRFIDHIGNVSGEGLYVKYEMFIRKLESRVNTLVGLSGSFFAARKEVCRDWAHDLQSDFNTLLNSVKLGLKGISDPKSVGYYKNIADERKEFERKVRTVLRGITVFMQNLNLLNPRAYGMLSWQLFSHKLCRWVVPYFMAAAILTNIYITINSGSLIFPLILQFIFYGLAFHYYLTQVRKYNLGARFNLTSIFLGKYVVPFSRICYYFISVNYSIIVAWLKYFTGKRTMVWEPSKR